MFRARTSKNKRDRWKQMSNSRKKFICPSKMGDRIGHRPRESELDVGKIADPCGEHETPGFEDRKITTQRDEEGLLFPTGTQFDADPIRQHINCRARIEQAPRQRGSRPRQRDREERCQVWRPRRRVTLHEWISFGLKCHERTSRFRSTSSGSPPLRSHDPATSTDMMDSPPSASTRSRWSLLAPPSPAGCRPSCSGRPTALSKPTA